MSPEEYYKEHCSYKRSYKIDDKKRAKGKDGINIEGTKTPMPWDEVYTRIMGGMSMEHIAEIYGNGCKIAAWAMEDGIKVDETIFGFVDKEIENRRTLAVVKANNETMAKTMLEMVNEYAPDIHKEAVLLSQGLIRRATTIINDDDATSADVRNIAGALQTITDTLEITQRHSSAVNVAAANIQVQGFDFVLDAPEEKDDETVIEGEIDDTDSQQEQA